MMEVTIRPVIELTENALPAISFTSEQPFLLRLGNEFNVDQFREVMWRYSIISQGFPNDQDIEDIQNSFDWFYDYFHKFNELTKSDERTISSLDDLKSFFDGKYISELKNLNPLNQSTVVALTQHNDLIGKAKDVLDEYIHNIQYYLIDLSMNPFPVNEYQPDKLWKEWKHHIIPPRVVADWEQALACMNVKQYEAGCMMAYRAVETMVVYFYENMTQQPYQGEKWATIESTLKKPALKILGSVDRDELTEALDRAREFRNEFAHGRLIRRTVLYEDASYFIRYASKVITECVNRMVEKGKAWRIQTPQNPTFTCAALFVLYDMFGGGVVRKLDFKDEEVSPDKWPVHYLTIDEAISDDLYSFIQNKVAMNRERNLQSKEAGIKRLLNHVSSPASYKIQDLRRWISDQFGVGNSSPDAQREFVFSKLILAAEFIVNHNVSITDSDMDKIQNYLQK